MDITTMCTTTRTSAVAAVPVRHEALRSLTIAFHGSVQGTGLSTDGYGKRRVDGRRLGAVSGVVTPSRPSDVAPTFGRPPV